MAAEVPEFIKECVAESGVRLGLALDKLEWPSGGKDAAPSELNALIGFQCAVMRRDPNFHFYSEGTMANRGRIDLMGCNGDVSLAIEAKRLNDLAQSARKVTSDLSYLQDFRPSYCNPIRGHEQNDWWAKSPQRWGLLLMTSFLGNAVGDAWKEADPGAARQCLEGARWKQTEPFIELHQSASMQRFAFPIPLHDRWKSSTAEGWILCGAIPISN